MKNISLLLLTLLLTACGAIPEPDPIAISNFKPQALEKGDDTGIYLIRPNQFAGGGRDYWVAVDNQVVGDLSNNTYVFLSLDSTKNHSVNTVVSMAGQNFIGIPKAHKEENYFYYSVDFTTWIPKKLSKDVGKTLVSGMKEHKLDNIVRPNHGFDNLSMNPGTITDYMTDKQSDVVPDNEHGVVYFFRPNTTSKSMDLPASVWTKDKHLGAIKSKQYFAVKMPIGKHKLYRRDGDFRTLDIDVQKHKFTYVLLDQSLGLTAYNYKLVDLGSESEVTNRKVQTWLKTLTAKEPVPESQWDAHQKLSVERGFKFMEKHKSDFTTN